MLVATVVNRHMLVQNIISKLNYKNESLTMLELNTSYLGNGRTTTLSISTAVRVSWSIQECLRARAWEWNCKSKKCLFPSILVPAVLSTSALASLRTARLKHSGWIIPKRLIVSWSIHRLISIWYGRSLLIQIVLPKKCRPIFTKKLPSISVSHLD